MLAVLKELPVSVKLAVCGIVLGVGGLQAADQRYVLASVYQKSYVLNAAQAVRELRRELSIVEDADSKAQLEEELERVLDDLCHEAPQHVYCRHRE